MIDEDDNVDTFNLARALINANLLFQNAEKIES